MAIPKVRSHHPSLLMLPIVACSLQAPPEESGGFVSRDSPAGPSLVGSFAGEASEAGDLSGVFSGTLQGRIEGMAGNSAGFGGARSGATLAGVNSGLGGAGPQASGGSVLRGGAGGAGTNGFPTPETPAEPRCGDGAVDEALGETCDDGNAADGDGCPDGSRGTCRFATCFDGLHFVQSEVDVDCGGPSCGACPGGLLLSEVATRPSSGEYIEIYNPGPLPVSLAHVYLADFPKYFEMLTPRSVPHSSDFRVTFPEGASIAPGQYLVIALQSATDFYQSFGRYPDYDLAPDDSNAPAMIGEFSSASGLSDGSEVVVLYRFLSSQGRVFDLDYLVYGSSSESVVKPHSTPFEYQPDTPAQAQHFAAAPKAAGQALVRCDFGEGDERGDLGNGYLGHDETSEPVDETFRVLTGLTPGSPSPGCEPKLQEAALP